MEGREEKCHAEEEIPYTMSDILHLLQEKENVQRGRVVRDKTECENMKKMNG